MKPADNDSLVNNEEERWHDVALTSECLPGNAIERCVAGRVVALFNVGGDYHALDGVCAHQGGPLGEGTLDGCFVTCPWHGWRYDVRTGINEITDGIRQQGFRVRVFHDTVQIAIDLT